MPEVCPDLIMDVVTRVILPIVTLVVLLLGVRISSRALTRSVTPQVECFLRPRPASQEFEMVIANYGLGSAYNVSLSLVVDEDNFTANNVLLEWRKTEVPFSVIEPGGSVTTFFGMAHRLMGDEQYLKPFKAEIEYQWQPLWAMRRRDEKRSYTLDVRPFKGLLYRSEKDEIAKVLKPGLQKIAEAIKTRPRAPLPRDRRSDDRKTLERMESLMPGLFAEMREDLMSFPLKREFILQGKGWSYNAGQKLPLTYDYESHENLADKVGLLVNEGLITDITYNNTDRYVMSEPLAEYLLNAQVDKQEGPDKNN